MGKIKRKQIGKCKKFALKKSMGDKCAYCNCNLKFLLTLDHKNPISRGGKDEVKNLQTTCQFCNRLKGNMKHIEFKKYLKILNELKDMGKIFTAGMQTTFNFNPYQNVSHTIMEENNVTKK